MSSKNIDTKKDEVSLEESFKELEEVIKKMEDNEVSLDESFKLFKRGTSLVQDCKNKIDLIEKEVKIINDTGEIEGSID